MSSVFPDWKEKILDGLLVAWIAAQEVAIWLDEQSAEWPPLSWVIHGVMAIPIGYSAWGVYQVALLAGVDPRPAYFLSVVWAVYGWRELEQITHRILNGVPLQPWDHTMDVVVPSIAGWWIG